MYSRDKQKYKAKETFLVIIFVKFLVVFFISKFMVHTNIFFIVGTAKQGFADTYPFPKRVSVPDFSVTFKMP